MAAPAIAARALLIAKNLVVSSKNTVKGATSTATTTVSRTRDKIRDRGSKIRAERKKQLDIKRKSEEDTRRAAKENATESTNKVKPVVGLVGIVKKSLQSFWKLVQAWVVINLPKILEEIRKFVKKIRIIGASIKRAVILTGSVFSSIGKIAKALVKNILNFDFTDKSGEIRKAREELETSVDGIGSSLNEIITVWGREEDELDYILTELESGQNIENIRKDILSHFPEIGPRNPAFGPGSSGGGNVSGGSSSGDSLFNLIGTGEGGYDSVNRGNAGDTPGGAEAIFGKPLTEMTVGEVVSAQQSGQVFAVGKYQIIPDTMTGFLRNSDIKMGDKFDQRTQEKFKEYVINVKRPAIGRYLRGESDDRDAAAQAVAREFASVGLTKAEAGRGRGQSRYAGTGNNAASINPDQVASALDADRSATLSPPQSQSPQTPGSSNVAPPSGSEGAALASSAGRLNKNRLDTSRYGRNGCVFAVNEVYKASGLTPPWGTSVYVPNARAVLIRKGYIQVGAKNAQPGDIVIMGDRGTPPWVHIGIVSNSGTVLHNSSTNQAFTNNESFSSLTRRYVKIEVYRAPSVVAAESSNKASAVNGKPGGSSNSDALSSAKTIASRRTGGTQIITNTTVLKQDHYVVAT